MKSVKLLLKNTPTKSGLNAIIIQIIEDRKKAIISTGYKIPPKFWTGSNVSNRYPDSDIINAAIEDQLSRYRKMALHAIADNSKMEISSKPRHTVNSFLTEKSKHYRQINKPNYASHIATVQDDLKKCFGPSIPFANLTTANLEKWHQYLIGIGNAQNTIHKKFKTLRQFVNSAIKDDIYAGKNRVDQYQVKRQFVRKDKLSVDQVAKIESLALSGELAKVRDLFLFSYYCKGMRFKNCYSVQQQDIQDGRVFFRKISKSGKQISIKIHSKLQLVIDRNPNLWNNGQASGSYNAICNRYLKLISEMIGYSGVLTFHMARHSFANNLKRLGVSTEVISDALGHSDTKITMDYLASLDDEIIDGEVGRLYQ